MTPRSRAFAEREVLPEFFRVGVVKDVPYQFVRKDGVDGAVAVQPAHAGKG